MKFLALIMLFTCLGSLSAAEWADPPAGQIFGVLTPGEGVASRAGGVCLAVATDYGVPQSYVEFFEGTVSLGVVSAYSGRSVLRKAYFTPGTRQIHAVIYSVPRGGGKTILETLPAIPIEVSATRPAPDFIEFEERNVTRNSATLICTVDNHGIDMQEWRFEVGQAPDQLSPVAVTEFDRLRSWPVASLNLQNLAPATDYYWRFVVRTNDGTATSETRTFSTLPNAAPFALNYIHVVQDNPDLDVVRPGWLGSDPDGEALTIIDIGSPSHGTAEIVNSFGTPSIRYTPDATFAGTDSVSYTIADAYGARADGILRFMNRETFLSLGAGGYSILLTDHDWARPVGTLNLTLLPTGSFSGYFTIYGERFGFMSHLDSSATGQFELPRFGRPPLTVTITLYSEPFIAANNLHVHAQIHDQGIANYGGEGPALLPPTEPVPEAGQYNTILPAEDVAASGSLTTFAISQAIAATPQGHGYAVLKMTKRGRITGSGRLGDNEPFSVGSRLRIDRKVMVFSKCSSGSRGRLFGYLNFGQSAASAGMGQLSWYNPQRPSGPYASGFTLQLKTIGERFDVAFSKQTTPWATAANVLLKDHDGNVVMDAAAPVAPRNQLRANAPSGPSVQLRINARNGLFRGSLSGLQSRPLPVRGIIQPGRGTGSGVFGRKGLDAPIELLLQN